ncbi:hypothetical protein V5O48_011603 [Marasmius crinis-equi]|uniref:Uncharacterized protein n=1 Tax=Marasmius crinis-equi TaxID=585013 RepID=A0ABR3F578_9AGAR
MFERPAFFSTIPSLSLPGSTSKPSPPSPNPFPPTLGTASQALLELNDSSLFFLGCDLFNADVEPYGVRGLEYAQQVMTISEDDKNALANGDGAVGDPASLGVTAVMPGRSIPMYREAADKQLNSIVNEAPSLTRLAIVEKGRLYIHGTPPFIAYCGIITNNLSLLPQFVDQCRLYRQILRAEGYSDIWRHILNPSSTPDRGLWSTRNAWAAAGMTRVLATVIKAPDYLNVDKDWRASAEDLTSWIKEILDAAIASPMDQGLLRNYLDDTWDDGHGFGEISGSSLLAAVAYRMAVLRTEACGRSYVDWADGIRTTLGSLVSEEGVVAPAVNPLAWWNTNPWTTGSPEGQNFVVMMYAAWRDCVLVGKCPWPTAGHDEEF